MLNTKKDVKAFGRSIKVYCNYQLIMAKMTKQTQNISQLEDLKAKGEELVKNPENFVGKSVKDVFDGIFGDEAIDELLENFGDEVINEL